MSDLTEPRTSWLSPEELSNVRSNVPLVYVDAVPVRVDSHGRVTKVGLLLRVAADGSLSRMLVSGRVLYGERVRDALIRHLEKDLGPLALPRVPTNPAPFTIAEYFPDPDVSGFFDPRHHAVSLAYVVPVDGECTVLGASSTNELLIRVPRRSDGLVAWVVMVVHGVVTVPRPELDQLEFRVRLGRIAPWVADSEHCTLRPHGGCRRDPMSP